METELQEYKRREAYYSKQASRLGDALLYATNVLKILDESKDMNKCRSQVGEVLGYLKKLREEL